MRGESSSVWQRASIFGVTCVALLIVVYALAVFTVPGQRFEDAVLRAADAVAGSPEQAAALNTLGLITVPTAVAGVLLVFLVGALRRRFLLATLAVVAMAGAVVTTELIQRYGIRPILLQHGHRRYDQSFPSGHTTVATALMCGLVLVAPYRFRGLTVALGLLFATGVGVATVTASWHRPSDTIGATLIVVGYGCATVAVLTKFRRVRPAALPTVLGRTLRVSLATVVAGVAVLSFAGAAVAVVIALRPAHESGSVPATLAAGRLLALGAGASAGAALLALLRRVDIGAPPEPVNPSPSSAGRRRSGPARSTR
ncbi:phosphatase PAP2 family protein [Actinoplanes sp. KI2]|uniref:phosphatase PAP2 family protein n=1 Tax=Actinoplanes sp. KI2 TaxID=2983315 RepID=UPI0021D5AB5B|nr:phosphatase PAP2 family protein [Actinoplanes sp. KI2]MCU7726399.1 phosphatase PAP2 family protein [Actinoplanes sp. KI2]